MFSSNEYAMISANKEAYDNAFREAQKIRMLRSAGLLRPSRFSKIACRGAGCLGRLLVAFGRSLESVEARSMPSLSSAGISPD